MIGIEIENLIWFQDQDKFSFGTFFRNQDWFCDWFCDQNWFQDWDRDYESDYYLK